MVEEWRDGGEDMLVAVVVGESGGSREVASARFWRRVERKAAGSKNTLVSLRKNSARESMLWKGVMWIMKSCVMTYQQKPYTPGSSPRSSRPQSQFQSHSHSQ